MHGIDAFDRLVDCTFCSRRGHSRHVGMVTLRHALPSLGPASLGALVPCHEPRRILLNSGTNRFTSSSLFARNARAGLPQKKTKQQEQHRRASMSSASVAPSEVREESAQGSNGGHSAEGYIKIPLRSFNLSLLNPEDVKALQARPRIDFSAVFETVEPIVKSVQTRGDEAVKEYTSRFDKVTLENTVENVADLPDPQLPSDVKAAFDVAFENIRVFHAAQQKSQALKVETMPGVTCKRVARAINSVGLYVPGGTAVLPSTALMLAVPAQIAGCKIVVIATPPRPDGTICPEVLYCAKKAGATHILKAGGAQAVAAMAWGTASCPKVDKILGPGNQYVTAAKMLLQNSEAMVSMDMPAGPSEVLVIADKFANPVHVAADLLSQAEHGPDSQVVLVAVGEDVDVNAFATEVERQCNMLPRKDIAAKALFNSFTVVAANKDEACRFSNMYAPEHLIVNVENPESWLDDIENAGSVFLGKWSPESVGDYASGTNHVLPTYGYARMYGGVSLDSFVKYMTVQSLSFEGLTKLGPFVARMAEVEGLDAHARAVTLRLADHPPA